MNRLYLISIFVVALVVVGCDEEPAQYAPLAPTLPNEVMDASRVVLPEDSDVEKLELPMSLKEKVLENCLIVQAAVEEFAAANGGYYPYDSAQRTPAGDTFIDLLPEGMLLENPVYLCRIEPVNGAACVPGQTGYVYAVNTEGKVTGYLINGYGMKGEIVQLYKDPNGD